MTKDTQIADTLVPQNTQISDTLPSERLRRLLQGMPFIHYVSIVICSARPFPRPLGFHLRSSLNY